MKEIRTKQELDEILNSESRKVFAKTGTSWCNPCGQLQKIILDVEGAYLNDYLFVGIDCDESDDDLINLLSIYNLPTIIVFNGHEELYRRSGLLTRAQLTTILDNFKQK